MRIWVDLANSPHVPFFRAVADEFTRRGHDIETTARRFAQTVDLSEKAGFAAQVIGGHGGRELSGKFGNLIARARALRRWARKSQIEGGRFDLAVSHNSYAQIVAARSLGMKTVTLMDYEHQPANHLAFRLASRVIVPAAFPEDALRRTGARASRVARYDGIKEDVYLAGFVPDPLFPETLERAFGIARSDVLVIVRPPAREALYHRFENDLFDALLARLAHDERVRVMMLARTPEQRALLGEQHGARFIYPEVALDGANLIAAADLVASAGGTMNREAAALGTPAATVYAGRWAAVDEQLVREQRLTRISTNEDLQRLRLEKKHTAAAARTAHDVRAQVVNLILSSVEN